MLYSHRNGTWSASSYSFVSTCKCSRGYCCTSNPWVPCWYCRYSPILLSAAIYLTTQVLWMPWSTAKLRLYLLERVYSWHARNHSRCSSPTISPASMSLTVATLEEEINKHPRGLCFFNEKYLQDKGINCLDYLQFSRAFNYSINAKSTMYDCVCVCVYVPINPFASCVNMCACVLMLLLKKVIINYWKISMTRSKLGFCFMTHTHS